MTTASTRQVDRAVLHDLAEHGVPATVRALSDRTGHPISTVSHALARLAKGGLVASESTTDAATYAPGGTANQWSLTPEGAQAVAADPVDAAERATLSGHGERAARLAAMRRAAHGDPPQPQASDGPWLPPLTPTVLEVVTTLWIHEGGVEVDKLVKAAGGTIAVDEILAELRCCDLAEPVTRGGLRVTPAQWALTPAGRGKTMLLLGRPFSGDDLVLVALATLYASASTGTLATRVRRPLAEVECSLKALAAEDYVSRERAPGSAGTWLTTLAGRRRAQQIAVRAGLWEVGTGSLSDPPDPDTPPAPPPGPHPAAPAETPGGDTTDRHDRAEHGATALPARGGNR